MDRVPNILVVQFRRAPSVVHFEQELYARCATGLAQLHFTDAFSDAEPWNEPEKITAGKDAVIFGGSGDLFFDGGRPTGDDARLSTAAVVARLESLVEYVFVHHIPLLGICFGHQLVGYVRGAEIRNDAVQSKTGSFEVCLSDAKETHTITKGLPKCFVAQYWHADSVVRLPEGAEVIASGKNCNSSMIRYTDTQYTMQFHPELTLDDLQLRLSEEGVGVTEELKPSPEAIHILKNFFAIVQHQPINPGQSQ